ncbi:MAG: lysophospholipid acyltransferase family protein [Spirochaetales bacterium]|nr:lysophospholipid acyltransferase family protein [Spirochaetales bacterium]
MLNKERPEIPEEKIIQVNNKKKIDFAKKKYKFIYFDLWFHLLTLPFYLICYVIVFLCCIFFSFRVEGLKNRKFLKKQGCITVSNHCHYFDTILVNFVLFPMRVYVSVVQRNFEVPFVRIILRALRAFPIPSGFAGLKMITEPIGEALKRGYHIHILPEGNLVHLSQTIYRFKDGAFYQSYIHQVPVVPMVYVFTRRKLFGKELPKNWIKIKMVMGEPVFPPPKDDSNKLPKQQLKEMSEKIASWMEEQISNNHKN